MCFCQLWWKIYEKQRLYWIGYVDFNKSYLKIFHQNKDVWKIREKLWEMLRVTNQFSTDSTE